MLPLVSETQYPELMERSSEPALNALVTVSQAARFLGMREDFVVDLTKLGSIPCLRSGEARFIRYSDLVAYQRKREIQRQKDRENPLTKVREMVIAAGLYDTPKHHETYSG